MELDQKNELIEEEEELSGEDYLLTRADEQGFVTYSDILIAFPEAEENIEQLESILTALIETGIEVGSLEEIEARKREEGGMSEGIDQVSAAIDQQAYFDTIAIDDTIGLYLKEIGRVPLLTAEEEVMLAKRMEAGQVALERLGRNGLGPEKRAEFRRTVQDGLDAREHLIRANSRLVISVAKRYIGRGVPFLSDPGRKHWTHSRCQQVQLSTGPQVLHLRHVVDQAGGHTCNR